MEQTEIMNSKDEKYNMYSIVRRAYISNYMDAVFTEKIKISEKELEKDYYIIPFKKAPLKCTENMEEELAILKKIQETDVPVVIRKKDMAVLKYPLRYLATKENAEDDYYILFPIRDTENDIFLSDNLNHNVDLISTKISFLRSNQLTLHPDTKKEHLDKIGINFDTFQKRFKRHIQKMLDNLIGQDNTLLLFKDDEKFIFTLEDTQFLEFLFDTYKSAGEFFIKEKYEKVSYEYLQKLFIGLEHLKVNNIPVDLDALELRFNKILLKIEKIKLQQTFSMLSESIDWILKMLEDTHLVQKIGFIEKNHLHMIDCYKKIYGEITRTFR